MNKTHNTIRILPFLMLPLLPVFCTGQEAGLAEINIEDLEKHLFILAADEMEGRSTGEAGLDRAAEYLAAQARKTGLKAVDPDGDYFQEYTLVQKSLDPDRSAITVKTGEESGRRLNQPFYILNPDSDRLELSGEAVFAGYGIHSREDAYDDLEGLDLTGKIVLVMNRGPMDENGEGSLLENRDWANQRSFRYKLPGLVMRMPRAVLIVMDPKSGYRSLEEFSAGMARHLNSSRYVKELGEDRNAYMPELDTKIIFIHREVAEEILRTTGMSLSALQDSIDRNLRPVSFDIPGSTVEIQAVYSRKEKPAPNVAGMIEGSDSILNKEVVVYTAHFDHLGTAGNGAVYNGADDNASGTVALLEIAEAFMKVKGNLKRSVLILWVSGEEIGLLGSEYYSENPLIPLDQTVADLNLDMIGRVRTARDTGTIYGERVSVLGMDSIALIGGHQSSDLMDIHNRMTAELGMHTDLSLNDPDHPYRYFYRSDHFHFAKHDIPILFYSTGIHVDYHKVTDNYDLINFQKLEKVSELAFLVGYELATRTERIRVDNPFSDWGRINR